VSPLPAGWDLILPAVAHPRDGREGALIRHRGTGTYRLWDGTSLRSCPQDWATAQTGAWVLACRRLLGLSQVALAARIGLAPNTVARIERGELPLMPRTRLAIERIRIVVDSDPPA